MHYQILEKLGGQGTGVVHKAEDTRFHSVVALRLIAPELAANSRAFARLQRDALAASALNHPNICKVHEIGVDDGQAFFATELLEGTTVKHRLTVEVGGQPLPLETVISLGIEIADALAAAHEKSLIHGDLNPANIFVTTSGSAKILNFGFAGASSATEKTGASKSSADPSPYLSPEQVAGKPVDHRTDLFSFGAILYEMATGVAPFSGPDANMIFVSIVKSVPTSPSKLNPEIPADLERLINKALEKDPEARLQHASRIRADLKLLKHDIASARRYAPKPVAAPPPPPAPPAPAAKQPSAPAKPSRESSAPPSSVVPTPPPPSASPFTQKSSPSAQPPAEPPTPSHFHRDRDITPAAPSPKSPAPPVTEVVSPLSSSLPVAVETLPEPATSAPSAPEISAQSTALIETEALPELESPSSPTIDQQVSSTGALEAVATSPSPETLDSSISVAEPPAADVESPALETSAQPETPNAVEELDQTPAPPSITEIYEPPAEPPVAAAAEPAVESPVEAVAESAPEPDVAEPIVEPAAQSTIESSAESLIEEMIEGPIEQKIEQQTEEQIDSSLEAATTLEAEEPPTPPAPLETLSPAPAVETIPTPPEASTEFSSVTSEQAPAEIPTTASLESAVSEAIDELLASTPETLITPSEPSFEPPPAPPSSDQKIEHDAAESTALSPAAAEDLLAPPEPQIEYRQAEPPQLEAATTPEQIEQTTAPFASAPASIEPSAESLLLEPAEPSSPVLDQSAVEPSAAEPSVVEPSAPELTAETQPFVSAEPELAADFSLERCIEVPENPEAPEAQHTLESEASASYSHIEVPPAAQLSSTSLEPAAVPPVESAPPESTAESTPLETPTAVSSMPAIEDAPAPPAPEQQPVETSRRKGRSGRGRKGKAQKISSPPTPPPPPKLASPPAPVATAKRPAAPSAPFKASSAPPEPAEPPAKASVEAPDTVTPSPVEDKKPAASATPPRTPEPREPKFRVIETRSQSRKSKNRAAESRKGRTPESREQRESPEPRETPASGEAAQLQTETRSTPQPAEPLETPATPAVHKEHETHETQTSLPSSVEQTLSSFVSTLAPSDAALAEARARENLQPGLSPEIARELEDELRRRLREQLATSPDSTRETSHAADPADTAASAVTHETLADLTAAALRASETVQAGTHPHAASRTSVAANAPTSTIASPLAYESPAAASTRALRAAVSSTAVRPAAKPLPRNWIYMIGAAIGAIALIVVLALGGRAAFHLLARASHTAPETVTEHQLTFNSPENRLIYAAISPSGRYLAYSDPKGLHVSNVATGEVHEILLPEELRSHLWEVTWFPDNEKLLLVAESDADGYVIWATSIFSDPPRKLHTHANWPAISPDGSSIAFISGAGTSSANTNATAGASIAGTPANSATNSNGNVSGSANANGNAIWLMAASGESPHTLIAADKGFFTAVAWSPTGDRIAYEKSQGADAAGAIETIPVAGGAPTSVLSNSRLWTGDTPGFLWLNDGRMLLLMRDTSGADEFQTFSLPVDPHTGVTSAKPAKTAIAGFTVSATADSKQLISIRPHSRDDVYVGELRDDGSKLDSVRRLTASESIDHPTAWTHDSSAILFSSDRQGTRQLFKQNLDQETAQPLVPSSSGAQQDIKDQALITPDGSWILYWSAPPANGAGLATKKLMRVSVSGGTPAQVMETTADTPVDFICPRGSGGDCILRRWQDNQMVFYSLDPMKGQGPQLARTRLTITEDDVDWDISRDAARVALSSASSLPGQIRIIDLRNGNESSVPLPEGWQVDNVNWSASGDALFLTAETKQENFEARLELNGRAHVLLDRGRDQTLGPIIPAPDGRHVAFYQHVFEANAWLIEKF